MPTVWFIRHAESEANAGLPTTSPASVKITGKGRKQAEWIARTFTTQPDIIVTSPYIRTKQSAIQTLERFPRSLHEEWQVQEFTYLSPAQYQGTTIEERRPLAHAYWTRQDPAYVDGEGAESFSQFLNRVRKIFLHLNTFENEFIAIFSHEQFIRAALWILGQGTVWQREGQNTESNTSPEEMGHFHRFLTAFSMPNGSIVKLTWNPGETPLPGEIVTNHLPEKQKEVPGAVGWLQNMRAALTSPQPSISI